MKLYQIPLRRAETSRESLTTARLIMDLLHEEEYFEEAPDIDPTRVAPRSLFRQLPGPDYDTRVAALDIKQELAKQPKGYDVALAIAGDSTRYDEADRLLRELIEAGLAHHQLSRCHDFFEWFDQRQAVEDRLAELEAEGYERGYLKSLRDPGDT